jgi:carboxymethylenebutenolidase
MGENVEFQSNGGNTPGYLAIPKSGHGPSVVVIQEWWGLVPHIKDVCDRFADEGFVALAPDLYHGKVAKSPDEAGKMMMGFDGRRERSQRCNRFIAAQKRDGRQGRR